jgi:hypothetical protein
VFVVYLNTQTAKLLNQEGDTTILTRNANKYAVEQVKVKLAPKQATKAQMWSRGTAQHFNPALDGGGWSAPRPGRFTPEKDPVTVV